MADLTALMVADPSPARDELADVLNAAGFGVSLLGPSQLAVRDDPIEVPDLLLVSVSLGLQHLALVSLRFVQEGRSPTTVVFPEGGDDLELLETCVSAGYEYITPPFLPGLLRSRMTSCWERGQLTVAVEEMSVAASAREYEREMSIAFDIQAGFLPETLPAPGGWDLATRFRPAKHVSGDFYDAFELENGRRLGLVVADVCDKGVGAALFMALIRTLLRHTAEHADVQIQAGADNAADLPPGAGPLVQAVLGTNRYLTRNHLRQGYFATMFFAVLDPETGALVYINGGHNPPVLARKGGEWSLLPPTGPAVGMLPDSVFSLGQTVLEPGDTLFVYSDGVVEARSMTGELFGMNRLLDIVGTVQPGRDSEALVHDVDRSVRQHAAHAEQFDDITMLAVCRHD